MPSLSVLLTATNHNQNKDIKFSFDGGADVANQEARLRPVFSSSTEKNLSLFGIKIMSA
jgi:hypothetical protein